jgi:hypothetical protein
MTKDVGIQKTKKRRKRKRKEEFKKERRLLDYNKYITTYNNKHSIAFKKR